MSIFSQLYNYCKSKNGFNRDIRVHKISKTIYIYIYTSSKNYKRRKSKNDVETVEQNADMPFICYNLKSQSEEQPRGIVRFSSTTWQKIRHITQEFRLYDVQNIARRRQKSRTWEGLGGYLESGGRYNS